jgi:hypothetical protein
MVLERTFFLGLPVLFEFDQAWYDIKRPNVPAVISQATSSSSIDISTWGNPSAAYPTSSCNIGQYFGAQKLIVDITLCGDW